VIKIKGKLNAPFRIRAVPGTQHVVSLDCRGFRRFEKFWFAIFININKVTGKTPATSELGVMWR